MVSAGLANGTESKLEGEAAVEKPIPVRLRIGGKVSDDMGMRIRRPVAFNMLSDKRPTNTKFLKEILSVKEKALMNNGGAGMNPLSITLA
eukprot:10706441-Heterocapsa_arctica.AAC.1